MRVLSQTDRILSKDLWRDQRGVAAVEFALVLPILLLILFGIIQFGFIFVVQNSMQNAVREGARAMAVSTETGQALRNVGEDTAEERLSFWPFEFDDAVATPGNTGAEVSVSISIAMEKIALGDIFGLFDDDKLTAEVTMRKE